MRTLACMAWNYFSLLPLCAQLPEEPFLYPEYAPEELASVLLLGRKGRDEDLPAFRRGLLNCRKQLIKQDFAKLTLPIAEERTAAYAVSKS